MTAMAAPRLLRTEPGLVEGSLNERWRYAGQDILVQRRGGKANVFVASTIGRGAQEVAARSIDADYHFSPIIDGEVIVLDEKMVEPFLAALLS